MNPQSFVGQSFLLMAATACVTVQSSGTVAASTCGAEEVLCRSLNIYEAEEGATDIDLISDTPATHGIKGLDRDLSMLLEDIMDEYEETFAELAK